MKNTIVSLSSSSNIPVETMTAILNQWATLAQLVEDAVVKKTGGKEKSVLVWNLRVQSVTDKFNSYSSVNLCVDVDFPASGGIQGDATDNRQGLAVASSCSEVMIYPECVYWHGPGFPNLPNELAEQLMTALTDGVVRRNDNEYNYCRNKGLLESLR